MFLFRAFANRDGSLLLLDILREGVQTKVARVLRRGRDRLAETRVERLAQAFERRVLGHVRNRRRRDRRRISTRT